MGNQVYSFPVTIGKQEDGLWRVECPSFPGCFVDHASLEEALAGIQEGIRLYIELYKERGMSLPEPLDITDTRLVTLVPVAV
ncbi:MAG: type II toxin-antitoxin system HicB family antitoxin [Chloroflexi bacterium]|nr:type II toxin-antitoxin system HicB family antitoxin [Chloroflexota bacterium]